MTAAPSDVRRLVGSAWTSAAAIEGRRHWVVAAVRGDEAELRSVLTPIARHRVPWRALRDRRRWAPGWQVLPPVLPPADDAPA